MALFALEKQQSCVRGEGGGYECQGWKMGGRWLADGGFVVMYQQYSKQNSKILKLTGDQ